MRYSMAEDSSRQTAARPDRRRSAGRPGRRCGCCSSPRDSSSRRGHLPGEALAAVSAGTYDVALSISTTRETRPRAPRDSISWRSCRPLDGTLPVVVMTAWGSVEIAVEAMRRGARDFVEKPWDNDRLLSILRTQVELGRALRRGRRLEAENRLLRPARRPS